MSKDFKTNIGFDLTKEIADSTDKDWFLGSEEVKDGFNDKACGLVSGVHAWLDPINGIYTKTSATINHAVDFIEKLGKKYIPFGTVQRGREDWMNCASNAPDNEYEKRLNCLYQGGELSEGLVKFLKDEKYINPVNDKIEIADAFTSIGSGTTINGNSLKAPFEFIRLNGILPKAVLPDSDTMTWNEYHNPKRITKEMWNLAKKSREYLQLNYVKVEKKDWKKVLDIYWEIMDSYIDPVDGDFIKRLSADYNTLSYGYKAIINDLKKKPSEDGEGDPNMKIEIEVVKRLNSPDYLLRNKKQPATWHRIGNEKIFNAIAGDFSPDIEEFDIADSNIAEPIYFSSSFIDMIVNFFSKLKGK